MTNTPLPDHLIDGGHAHASETSLHAEDKGYHKRQPEAERQDN